MRLPHRSANDLTGCSGSDAITGFKSVAAILPECLNALPLPVEIGTATYSPECRSTAPVPRKLFPPVSGGAGSKTVLQMFTGGS